MGLGADSTRYCYGMYDLRQFYPSYWNIERERTRNNLHFMSTDSRFLCSCGLISIRFNTFDSIIDDNQIIQIGGSEKTISRESPRKQSIDFHLNHTSSPSILICSIILERRRKESINPLRYTRETLETALRFPKRSVVH